MVLDELFYLRDMQTEKILILDFGSQYTQLIARVIREANVYCEIIPYKKRVVSQPGLKGIILSGSPFSVNDRDAPQIDIRHLLSIAPVLGICYGAQLSAKLLGGVVEKSDQREYGRASLHIKETENLFKNISSSSQVWMSHSDTITSLPPNFTITATTDSIPVAAFCVNDLPLYGLQFHPEVYHSTEGKNMLHNFLFNI